MNILYAILTWIAQGFARLANWLHKLVPNRN